MKQNRIEFQVCVISKNKGNSILYIFGNII